MKVDLTNLNLICDSINFEAIIVVKRLIQLSLRLLHLSSASVHRYFASLLISKLLQLSQGRNVPSPGCRFIINIQLGLDQG